MLADEDPSLNDESRMQVYFGHFPSGTSLRALDHYAQILKGDTFNQYDFGKKQNREKYNSDTAPEIKLSSISKVPIAMFVGTADELATVEDNRWAKTQLNTLVHYKEYPLGHLSFMVAKDMTYFQDAMNLIKKYNPLTQEAEETQMAILAQE